MNGLCRRLQDFSSPLTQLKCILYIYFVIKVRLRVNGCWIHTFTLNRKSRCEHRSFHYTHCTQILLVISKSQYAKSMCKIVQYSIGYRVRNAHFGQSQRNQADFSGLDHILPLIGQEKRYLSDGPLACVTSPYRAIVYFDVPT